jgi:hypothetical protein
VSAAYLVDHVFPPLPVRQRGGVGAERLRWYLEREPKDVGAVLHIFLRVIGGHLRRITASSSPHTRFGAVSFVDGFDASLNHPGRFHY